MQMSARSAVRGDLVLIRKEQRYVRSFPAAWYTVTRQLLFGRHDGRQALLCIRLMQYWDQRGQLWLARWMEGRLRSRFGCYISRKARIGTGLRLPHPVGIVIGDGVRVGDNCVIFQHVTLGGGRLGDQAGGNYPTLGTGVTVYTGACIIGAVDIGDGAVIAANSVVRCDVPARAIAAGVPAKIKPAQETISSTG